MACRQKIGLVVGLALWLSAPIAKAVDESPIKIADRWSVVGVIAGDAPKGGAPTGIAVLRNNNTKKTYTLSVGDTLPQEFGYVLSSVVGHTVVVAHNDAKITLAFAETPASDGSTDSDAADHTARFLESYYRGLADSPIEILEPDDSQASDSSGSGLTRLGKGEGHSRYDFYRDSRSYEGRTFRLDRGDDGSYTVNDEDDGDNSARDEASEISARLSPVTPGSVSEGVLDE